jgi:hypothetical protein
MISETLNPLWKISRSAWSVDLLTALNREQHENRTPRSIMATFIFLIGWDWVHLVLQPLLGLLYQPQMIDDGECGAVGGMRIGRGNRSTRRQYSAWQPTAILTEAVVTALRRTASTTYARNDSFSQRNWCFGAGKGKHLVLSWSLRFSSLSYIKCL